MTKQEILDVLKQLSPDQELRWMIDLGAELTIAARGGYPVGEQRGDITRLVAFNEMQHQLHNRHRHLQAGTAWDIEIFLDALHGLAVRYGVEGEFGWAITTSLRLLGH